MSQKPIIVVTKETTFRKDERTILIRKRSKQLAANTETIKALACNCPAERKNQLLDCHANLSKQLYCFYLKQVKLQ